MKKFLFALISVALMCVGCSSDNDDAKEKESQKYVLKNTTWSSIEKIEHTTFGIFVDKEETNTEVVTKLQQISGLEYSENTKTEEKEVYWNVCNSNGHDADTTIAMTFSNNKCIFEMEVKRKCVKANLTQTEKQYKFKEGEFFVKVGYSSYESFFVRKDGVYRANGYLFLLLDGNGNVTYETQYKYAGRQDYDVDVDKYSVTADFSVSGNAITFSYIDKNDKKVMFVGTIADNLQSIIFNDNPLVSSVKSVGKQ